MEKNGPERARTQAAFRRRLGVTLRRIRETLTPFSQASIAEILGVDTETVGRWERGMREPKAWQLSLLAERYDLPHEVAPWLIFPTDSLTELDDRIEQIRTARLRSVAAAAAQADVEAELTRRDAADTGARRGSRRA